MRKKPKKEATKKNKTKISETKKELLFDQEAYKLLQQVIVKIKSPEQAQTILKDLMSSSEIKDLSRRLLAVKYLYGGATYEQISKMSNMSMGTINKMHFKIRGSQFLPDLLK